MGLLFVLLLSCKKDKEYLKPSVIAGYKSGTLFDAKRRPIIAVIKKIVKSENFFIPEIKVNALNEAIENTNLLEILNKYGNK